MGILLFLWNVDFRQWNFNVFILVPVLLSHGVRVMRVSKGNCKAEWTSIRSLANIIVKILRCLAITYQQFFFLWENKVISSPKCFLRVSVA